MEKKLSAEDQANLDYYYDEFDAECAKRKVTFCEDLMHPDDTRFAQGEMDDLERMEYEYNLIQWEKQHSY
tara:strand:- start:505 stop:714 length:210 start_codon:yes stop_codon:yes gene_type:complete